jgi:hypothetical protein
MVRNGVASIKTENSGFTLEISLPDLPVLQATIDLGACGDLSFIVGEKWPRTTHALPTASDSPLRQWRS